METSFSTTLYCMLSRVLLIKRLSFHFLQTLIQLCSLKSHYPSTVLLSAKKKENLDKSLPSQSNEKRNKWIALGILTILILLFQTQYFQKEILLNGDNSSYYRLGLSIAQGEYSSSTGAVKGWCSEETLPSAASSNMGN